MIISIYNLDGDYQHPLCTLGVGEHILGRGDVLKCIDKRVSRKHVQISLSETNVEITAMHEINPCFYKASQSKHISLLQYNKPLELSDDDTFGFFPDNHWYKIKITESPETNQIHMNELLEDNNQVVNNDILVDKEENKLKANIDACKENCDNENSVEIKQEPISQEQENNNQATENLSPIDNEFSEDFLMDTTINTNEHNDACDNTNNIQIKEEPASPEQGVSSIFNIKIANVKVRVETIKVEPDTNVVDIATTSSCNSNTNLNNSPIRRDRCWFGQRCYRKNPEHKLRFSHQGDADFDTDPDDTREPCQYGGQCYRRNGDHRKNFKHSRFDTNKPTKHKRCATPPTSDNEVNAGINPNNIVTGKRRKIKKGLKDGDEESDGETKEPFEASDSEEDFHISSEESDSDYD